MTKMVFQVVSIQYSENASYELFLACWQCFDSGSCFHKIYHYNALFLKTFSLAVSLNFDKLQVISAQTEK